MRRVLAGVLGFAVIATLIGAIVAGPSQKSMRYWVTLDNAFGLVNGGEVRVAGVNAGDVVAFQVDRHTYKALVEIEITKPAFALHADAFCESHPQSLIGEYYLDCKPGNSPRVLPQYARLPVTQSSSTVPFDLINDALRLPYQERLTVFLNGIGAGLAARGPQLNATIQRAVPALREFDRVLSALAQQNHTVADLDHQANGVVSALADNRRDVARWVTQTGRYAQASADQQAALSQTFQRFPAFLQQLTPAMASLGQVAVRQSPALVHLYDNAGQLRQFLSNLGPFSSASRPAVRALGQASRVGSQAIGPAKPVVSLLRRIGLHLPETATDLGMVLHDLDDPARATEPDPRSPGGKGFTGLQALLEYARNQDLTVNAFDQYGYVLRVDAFSNNCGPYTDAQTFKAHAAQLAPCLSVLGPNQPGVTTPDPTLPSGGAGSGSGGSTAQAAVTRPVMPNASALLHYLLAP